MTTEPPVAQVTPGAVSLRYARWALWGLVAYVVLDVILQLLPPHYSPLHQAESDLAVGPYGLLMNLNFLVRGALTAALLMAWVPLIPRSGWSRAGLVLLAIWGAASGLLAFFNTDILDDRRLVPHPVVTLHGEIHILLAVIGFIAAPLGAIALSVAWSRRGRPAGALIVTAGLALLALLAMPGFTRVHDLGGLGERAFLFFVLLWTALAAASVEHAVHDPSPQERT